MMKMERSASSSSVVLNVAAKPPLVEFPTTPSPSAANGEEITHYSHSKHPLMELTLPDLFTCSGCKEYGAGKRFSCRQCDFQLHQFCALCPASLKNHPLHAQHPLIVLHSKPKQAGISWPRCDVCGKSMKGFTFKCRACSFQMHPCCALLSTEVKFSAHHPHSLKLINHIAMLNNNNNNISSSSSAGGLDTSPACAECKKKRSGRMYRCTVCDYHVHAVCAKAMINGLQENGIKTPEKPSMLGTAARLASQVVIEFIGGLIEGFGEGVGEVLVQNIARGRCNSRRRPQRQ